MSDLRRIEALRRGGDCPSDLTLDRLQLGELAAETSAAVEAHAAGCASCRQRLADLDVERRAFQASPPWRLPDAPPRRWSGWRPRATAAVLGVAALAGVLVFLVRPPTERGDGATRTKGGVRFELFRARGELVEPLADGDRVRAGDRIQVAYSTSTAQTLAVLSRDGGGQLNVYFPSDRATTWPASAGVAVPLPASTQLDDVLGIETLYLVACARPTELAILRGAIASSAAPPPGCSIDLVSVTKEPAP